MNVRRGGAARGPPRTLFRFVLRAGVHGPAHKRHVSRSCVARCAERYYIIFWNIYIYVP